MEDQDEERGNMKKVQKTRVPPKAPSKKESLKKFFSRKLYSPKGDSQKKKNTGPHQVRLFGRSTLGPGAEAKTSANLSGHQDSQPNTC